MTDSSYDEESAAQVLKTDVLGRVKTSRAQRERLLDEFERSGLSGTKFAAVAGVNYQTFASWMQKRRQATGAYSKVAPLNEPTSTNRPELHPTNPALQWMEAIVVEDKEQNEMNDSCSMKLYLPGGMRVEVSHTQQITLVVELIAQLKLRSTQPC